MKNPRLEEKYKSYPDKPKKRLLELRKMILDLASLERVGPIEEELKWGQPSFLTSKTRSGSTIRINWSKKEPDLFFIYFNCQSQIIRIARELYPNDFNFGGNRSIAFRLNEKIPKKKLSEILKVALKYNLNNYKDFFKK